MYHALGRISAEQKVFAVVAHIAYLLGGLGFIVAPLLIFLLKKDDAFVYHHAKQSLVAQLALLVFSAVVSLLSFLLVGLLLVPALAVFWLVLFIASLYACYKAINGEEYKYPMIQWLANKF